MKALLCVLLCLLPGCAGILTGDVAPPAPVDMAFDITLSVTEGGAGSVGDVATLTDIGPNAKDSVFGLAGALSKLPLVGWMFAASKAGDIAGALGGGSVDSAVTPGVLESLARRGAKFTYSRKVVWKGQGTPK